MTAPALPPAEVNRALDHYRDRGYAVLRGVFSAGEIAALAASFDRHWREGLAHRASFRHGNLFYRIGNDKRLGKIVRLVQWPSYVDPALDRVRYDARMFAILAPLLGPDIKQIINQLHWKPPGAQAADFAFHQDVRFRRPSSAYRNLATSYVQTGIAIDPHKNSNGAMRIVPTSHRNGTLAIPAPKRILDGRPDPASLQAAGIDPATLIDLDLEPGDLALWNVYLVHGSGANSSAGDRRFYLNGYVRAADCDRGEWVFRDGKPCTLGAPALVHYDELFEKPGPHYVEE